jgi:hypothetical protein
MRRAYLSLLAAVVLAGCATFKELTPEPPLLPSERGYIELKNDDKSFALDEGKKYFIKFPPPPADNFTLALTVRPKKRLVSYLTWTFDDGNGPLEKIADDALADDSVSVFAINSSPTPYFWVLDSVKADLMLDMKYRYVPRWRYSFEKRYATLRSTLGAHRVDRSTYQGSSGAASIESVNQIAEIAAVSEHVKSISSINDEMAAVAALFPADIAAARDTDYVRFTELKKEVDGELQFQKSYVAALSFFRDERATSGNTRAFLEKAGEFADFLASKEKRPAAITEKAKKVISGRLNDVVPYYEAQLRTKNSIAPLRPSPAIEPVERLYGALGRGVPSDVKSLFEYIRRFNIEAEGLQKSAARLRELNGTIEKTVTPPAPDFYGKIASTAADIVAGLPESKAVADPTYHDLSVGGLLALETGKVREQATDLKGLFEAASQVSADITSQQWKHADAGIRSMSQGATGESFATAAKHRDRIQKWFEQDLYAAVRKATKERLDAFTKLNVGSFENVPALYADSAFLPVHDLTFSAGGEQQVTRYRAEIQADIDHVKHIEFPESAIKLLYKDFSRDVNSQGVERARAIVAHGAMYKGPDKQIGSMVSECDPAVAKWISKPKEYRRILALPTTTNKAGVNDYLIRVRLNIPSDAAFPVFDINIRLPKEIAESAGKSQWYEQMTINKTPLKNEGRFRITSPTAENGYEIQVSPVQMDKEGANILEIRFKKASFKVYEFSAMAQVPIMKKN